MVKKMDKALNEIMTVTDLAKYLKLAERTILRLVHDNTLPAARVGNQWRFLKSVIDEWLIKSMNLPVGRTVKSDKILISGLLDPEYINTDISPGPKSSVIRQMVGPLAEKGIISSSSLFVQKLITRENMHSTGIGGGIAFPHLRHPLENPDNAPAIIAGVCRKGTDFDSLDRKPVKLFFLLCIKDETTHIKIMSQLSFLLKDSVFRDKLIDSASPENLISLIRQAETGDKETKDES